MDDPKVEMLKPAIILTREERERLKSILGTMVSRGINPNPHNDERIITSRADQEMVISIFNKLVDADDKEKE